MSSFDNAGLPSNYNKAQRDFEPIVCQIFAKVIAFFGCLLGLNGNRMQIVDWRPTLDLAANQDVKILDAAASEPLVFRIRSSAQMDKLGARFMSQRM
jgi:hypothetical protein